MLVSFIHYVTEDLLAEINMLSIPRKNETVHIGAARYQVVKVEYWLGENSKIVLNYRVFIAPWD